LPEDQVNAYDNLILLCAADHRKIDAQPEAYPVEALRRLKHAHEQWVELTLAIKEIGGSVQSSAPVFVRLDHTETGKQLLGVVGGCHAWQFEHTEPQDEEEAGAIADIFQNAEDWGSIYDEIGAGGQVRAGFGLTDDIRALGARGLSLWGGRVWAPFAPGKPPVFGWIAALVMRRDSEEAAKRGNIERILTEWAAQRGKSTASRPEGSEG